MAEFYPDEKFVIVHGGGSFGHHYAKEYSIREGLSGELGGLTAGGDSAFH
ncbi:hypothetical protein [Thermococcus sp. JCM 11816]